jgi:hypothetical protein
MTRIPGCTRCSSKRSGGGSIVATPRSAQWENIVFGMTFTTGAELPPQKDEQQDA